MKKQNLTEFTQFSEDKFTKRIIYREGATTAFVLNFAPGQKLPAHHHPGADLYLMVLSGFGEFTVDGEKLEVTAQDVLYAGGEEEMSFENTGEENVSLYVQLINIPDERYAKEI
ncbi:cupin domain-containing protein [Evansella sp. LMS18]|uniref:cupin domain-containing protein n=1 Tax=Evansella sp. LMS18 TaxID=2924033 RepID=UPI0020D02091|nr:cupin domain-containing protein [Evansella sp. LMS18]UTR09935.1 cupin domain-containing protein [Evansella sp. LMS18]